MKIRVLHSLVRVGAGGVEQRRLTLARDLDRDLYEQRILCTEAIGGLPPLFAEAGCAIHQVGLFKGILDPKPYRRALQVIREFKPHIIHGAVYEGVALAAIAGRLGQVPIIIGEETSDPADRRWTGHTLYRLLCSMTHHMVGVSPAVRDYLVHKIHVRASKVSLINNGVTAAPPATTDEIFEIRQRYGLEPDHFVIGTVSRLVDSHKRVSDLIRAMPLVLQACPGARLVVVGDGPDEGMLRELAGKFSVAGQVCFAGYQSNPQPYYEVMDVFAMASAHEAFGLVLVEAMQNRLPVVATRVGGIPSVVEEGETGLLVEPMQPEELATAILGLYRDDALRHVMGQRGSERAAIEFSAGRYVQEVDYLYQKLLAMKRTH